MANYRVPGALCGSTSTPIDEGTLILWTTAPPGPFCKLPAPPEPRKWHHYSRHGGFPAATLTMSPEAVALLQSIETLRLKPYDDQTAEEIDAWIKGATIGYGHLISEPEWEKFKDGITQVQAEALFRVDAAPFEATVGETVVVGVQQYEFDAMVILAFNIGKAGFRKSSVARLINTPKEDGKGLLALELAWKAWNKSQGKINNGLKNRRAAEWRIYTDANYMRW